MNCPTILTQRIAASETRRDPFVRTGVQLLVNVKKVFSFGKAGRAFMVLACRWQTTEQA